MGYVVAIVILVVVFIGPAIAILRSRGPSLLIRIVWAVLSLLMILAFIPVVGLMLSNERPS